MTEPTLYDAIGVTPDASEKTIYKTAKKMARSVKESDSPSSEKKKILKFLKSALETLMEPTSREAYDRTIGIETIHKIEEPPSTHMNPLEGIINSIVPMSHSSMVPFGGMDMSSRGSMDPIGSILSNHMGMIKSIIPDELGAMSSNMQSGSFHFMEYTKVKNSSGGYDEFGVTREGDNNNNRVTEKRFHKKS